MRTTVATELTDAMLVRRVLSALAIEFEERGSTFTLHGASKGIVIDVTSGRVQAPGEVDVDAGVVGRIRQHYAEQLFLVAAEKQGVVVQAREVNADGSIVLRCQLAPPSATPPAAALREFEVSALGDGWYEPAHGRSDRVALVYLSEVGVSALRRARTNRTDLTDAEEQAITQEARVAVARRLGKPVEQLDRVDLLDDSEARFKVLTTSFREGLGEIVWSPTLSEEERALWETIGKRRDYVTTVIVAYPTKADGTLDEAQLSSGCRVLRWRFRPETYDLLRKLNRGLRKTADGGAIVDVDLLVTCTGPRTRRPKITLAGPAAYRRDEALKRAVLGQAVTLYERLTPSRTMTEEEIRERLPTRRAQD